MTEAYIDATTYIDSWLDYFQREYQTPGIAVAIRYKGELLLNAAYGHANVRTKAPLTSNHLIRIASQSKMFTAVAVLQLQEQGKLKIDEPIAKYLKWLNDHTDKRWQNVTVRQVLSHGAGITRDSVDGDFWSLDKPFPSKTQLKDIILDNELVIDNNVQLKYSNIGYGLLGLLIEKVSRTTYARYVNQHIISPLKLKNTYVDYKPVLKEQLASGYGRASRGNNRQYLRPIATGALVGATGFCSTAADISRFVEALAIGSGELLNDESKKEMQRSQWKVSESQTEEYGLGLIIDTINGQRFMGHSGGFPGHVTRTVADFKDDLVISLLFNSIDAYPKMMIGGIYNILRWYGDNYDKTPQHDLSKFNGRFGSLWGDTDIVTYGNTAISVWPGAWDPFGDTVGLEYETDTSLKIVRSHGHGSYGEHVKYDFDRNHKVKKIRWAGASMLPL